MKANRLAELLIFDVFRNQGVHTLIAAESDEIRCKAHQLGKGAKRLIEQVKTYLVACFACLEIALVALCISRVVLIYLAQIF